MSFILDALRKSEHERRRGLLPGVAQVPYALPRAPLPVWVPVALGALAAALVFTGFAWWYTTRPAAAGAPRLAASTDVVAPQRSHPAPPSVAPQPSASAPAFVAPPRTADPPPRSAPQPAEQRAAEQRTQALAPSSARVATPAPPTGAERAAAALPDTPPESDALPSASALAASGVVPPLKLQLIFYDADAAKRFVYVNGRRYSEGALLDEGPQVMRIENRGVVLRHQGRDFRLVPE